MSREGKEQELVRDYKQILSAYKDRLIDEDTTISRLLGSSEMWLLPNHPLKAERDKFEEAKLEVLGEDEINQLSLELALDYYGGDGNIRIGYIIETIVKATIDKQGKLYRIKEK